MTTAVAKLPIQVAKYIRNGKVPAAELQNALAEATNQACAYRTKEVARFTTPIASIPVSGVDGRWRFAFRSSPHAKYLRARAVLAQTGGSGDPYATLTILDNPVDSLANTVGTVELHYGAGNGPDTPAFFGICNELLQNGGAVVELDPDTDYFGVVADDAGISDMASRIVAISIYEEVATNFAFLDENHAATSPIHDSHREDVATRLRTLWKHGGAPLITWSVQSQSSPLTTTSATATNLVDTSVTGAVTASSPGWTLDLRNRKRAGGAAVGCTLWVRAKMSSGIGDVHIANVGDGAIDSVTVDSATEQWFSTSLGMPATLDKFDLQMKTDGNGGTLSVYAVTLIDFTP